MDKDETKVLSWSAKFWILNKFYLPLVAANIAQGVSVQALSRGITSVAGDGKEMTDTLASYGLAFSMVQILVFFCVELKNVGLALVYSRQDNVRMTALSIAAGTTMSLFLFAIKLSNTWWHTYSFELFTLETYCVSPAGIWLIRDLHKQNDAVVKISCQALLYLAALPLIEAIASYYEGYLNSQRLTLYTGMATFVDCGVQIVTTITLIFVAPRLHPIVIPVLSWYGGTVSRMLIVLCVWRICGREKLADEISEDQAATSIKKALFFWLPLTTMRVTQRGARVIINLVISRILSENVSPEAAAEALAVIAAIFPMARILNTWVFDIKQVVAAFCRKSDNDAERISLKELALYSVFVNLCSVLLTALLVLTPGATFFLLNTVLGVNKELSTMSFLPLIVYSFGKSLTAGFRGFAHGVLITEKKTIYVTPGSILRIAVLFAVLYSLPITSSESAALVGMASFVISFTIESIFVVTAALLVAYKAKPIVSCGLGACGSEEEIEETQKLLHKENERP